MTLPTTTTTTAKASAMSTATRTAGGPYGGMGAVIPGVIEAEEFDIAWDTRRQNYGKGVPFGAYFWGWLGVTRASDPAAPLALLGCRAVL